MVKGDIKLIKDQLRTSAANFPRGLHQPEVSIAPLQLRFDLADRELHLFRDTLLRMLARETLPLRISLRPRKNRCSRHRERAALLTVRSRTDTVPAYPLCHPGVREAGPPAGGPRAF